MPYRRIYLIGTGNVAWHLANRFLNSGLEVSALSRSGKCPADFETLNGLQWLDKIAGADPETLVLICTNDAAIADVFGLIPTGQDAAFTAGTVSLSSISDSPHLGVFYPLQTLTRGIPCSNPDFPILYEANSSDLSTKLGMLASQISHQPLEANSATRMQYHLSAVWANNFSNHLWHIAFERLHQQSLDPALLLPLIRESVAKLDRSTPFDAQTGPARRNDQPTIARHLELLTGDDRALYQQLTEHILATYFKQHD